MKKRQVMALLLAVALAVPSVSLGAEIAPNAPTSVEASSDKPIYFEDTNVKDDYGMMTLKDLQEWARNVVEKEGSVKKTTTKTKVGDVISVGGNWQVLNAGDALKRGDENVVRLKYTLEKDYKDPANGWELENGVYVAEFEVNFEAVEPVAPAVVFESTKWPELKAQPFNADKETVKDYWNEDLKSGSSSYGTFSFENEKQAVSAAANSIPVDVTFKLNPGYEFAYDVIDGYTYNPGETERTKSYSVNVTKQEINNIVWPEIKTISGNPIAYGVSVRDLDVTFSNKNGVNFVLEDSKKNPVNASDDTLKLGSTNFLIHATPADSVNYVIPEKDQYKNVTVEAAAPSLTGVKILNNANGEPVTSINQGVGGASITLRAEDEWNVSPAAVYELKHQWYRNDVKINGATAPTYTVREAGAYSCEVSAVVDKNSGSIGDYEIYKNQPAKSSQKAYVAFSAINIDRGVGITSPANKTPTFGASQSEYIVPITGLPEKAEMSLVITDGDGKDVTSSMISGTPSAIADKKATFKITVDKNTDVGVYNFAVKIVDGNSTVILSDADLTCDIQKKDIKIKADMIKPVNKDLVHGDQFDKLTGFEYVAGDATTDEKKNAKDINDKIQISVKNWKNSGNGFTKGYFESNEGTKEVSMNVELKEDSKKNYRLIDVTNAPISGAISVPVSIGKKDVTLGVESLEMIKGENLPKRVFTGTDGFLETDKVKVSETEWEIYEKGGQKKIQNAVKSLEAGSYTVVVKAKVNSQATPSVNVRNSYDIKGRVSYDSGIYSIVTDLTIYKDQHTVGFVTDGGNAIADINVYHNNAIGTLPTPIRSGYKFLGWYADKNFATPVNASTKVTGDMILFAKWEKVSSTSDQTPGSTVTGTVKKGTSVKVSGESAGTYVVTSTAKKTVSYKTSSKTITKITIPAAIRINGVTYKVTKVDSKSFYGRKKLTKVVIASPYVTEIGTSAFSGCSKLKSVTFKTSKITKIGKSAFKGISKKSAIKVPKSKKTSYKKMLRKSGYTKTVK